MKKSNFILLAIIFFVIVLYSSCDKKNPTQFDPPFQLNYISLQNQTEHSGIMVKIKELDQFVITDSLGFFNFDSLPNGNFILKAKYPYFATREESIRVVSGKIEPPVHLELKQLLQFWIEPPETSISINNDPNYCRLTGFRLNMANLTDSTVTVQNSKGGTLHLEALKPIGFSWPTDNCHATYGMFIVGNLAFGPNYTFQPKDTVSLPSGSIIMEVDPLCLSLNKYLLYATIPDQLNFKEYFDIDSLQAGTPNQPRYNQMNSSLLKKINLFRPMIVHITN
jgi:hypothetical protein